MESANRGAVEVGAETAKAAWAGSNHWHRVDGSPLFDGDGTQYTEEMVE
ncbi:MAG: hypothetical protein ACK2UU_21495 [Anaerolineae bacterium]|jgi:hypothetical protein